MNLNQMARVLRFLSDTTSMGPSITDSNRTFKTQPDSERFAAAEAKRARKNAKRAKEFRV